jgi:glycine/D-amino acid oxidase-like deaminating enzyme
MLVMGLIVVALGIVGFGLLLSLIKLGHFASIAAVLLRAVAGIGLIAGSVGGGALLLLALNSVVKMLGNYARLHYRLLKPEQDLA